jgi:5-methylcytosine-specific restriction protein A
MIKEFFQGVLEEYESAKQSNAWESSIVEVLKKYLPEEMKKLIKLDFNYLFEGSVGVGNFAEVPWVRVFEEKISPSAQEQYYIVYLFDAKMQGFYLSLNQGVTQYNELYGLSARQAMIKNTQKIIGKLKQKIDNLPEGLIFSTINLNSKTKLGEDYELTHICGKFYQGGLIPEDTLLVEDLRKMIKVYEKLKEIVGIDILNIDEDYTPEERREIRSKNRELKRSSLVELKMLKQKAKLYESGLSGDIEEDEYLRIKKRIMEIEGKI